MLEVIRFKKLRDVQTPSRSYSQAAGWDFYIPRDWHLVGKLGEKPNIEWESKTIAPGESLLIPSGIQLQMSQGIAMRFDNKSGVASKGLIVGASIVDSDYQGEVHLNVWNVSKQDITVRRGQKLLQGIFFHLPLTEMYEVHINDKLFTEVSDRGKSGFGSTDIKY